MNHVAGILDAGIVKGSIKKNQKADRQNQLEFPQYIIKITG
ncbi:hypothetical protein QUB32_09485 [Microcoleus sp. AT8-A4]